MSSPHAHTTLSRPSLEARAGKILDALHGYMHRQEWQVKDRKFVADLLQDWDVQVTQLLNERDTLQRYAADLGELNRRNEWRLAGSGFGHYIKFLLGVAECPSR